MACVQRTLHLEGARVSETRSRIPLKELMQRTPAHRTNNREIVMEGCRMGWRNGSMGRRLGEAGTRSRIPLTRTGQMPGCPVNLPGGKQREDGAEYAKSNSFVKRGGREQEWRRRSLQFAMLRVLKDKRCLKS